MNRRHQRSLALVVLFAVLLVLAAVSQRLIGGDRSPANTTGPATASWYQVYFTSPKYPDSPANHKGGIDEKFTSFIKTATTSIDMAIYQFDLEKATLTLLDVKKRGVSVRVVTGQDILDDPKENPSFKRLQAVGITVVGGNPNAIMHNKYVVVDSKAVWTGSWNFTLNDTYRYNNNAISINSADLARNYTANFEKMWRDKLFGARRKPGGTTPSITIEGAPVSNYFSPEDNVTDKIVAALGKAGKTIDFLAFSFTDDRIGEVLLARAKAGVKIRGVFENTGSETQFSEYGKLKAAGVEVLQDGNPYLMHHKVFIVDGRVAIFGSFNFSANAEESNDENLLIVDDSSLAGKFSAEFDRVHAQAKNPPVKNR